jgi:PPOX class probable F420-dependent enzyme
VANPLGSRDADVAVRSTELMSQMNADIMRALQGAKILYLTTYNRRGQSGTVPIWFFLHQENIYFCTLRDSLKVRRLRQTGRATLHMDKRTGPRLECTARLLADDVDLQQRLLHAYRRRYWVRWLILGFRLRRAFARGEEIIVQLTPAAEDTIRPERSQTS